MAREGIMLAYAWDEKRFNRFPKPCYAQPKLEGDRCRAVFDAEGKVKLYSSGNKLRDSVPHIVEQLEDLNIWSTELDGELFVLGMPHEQIRSIVSRTVNLHEDYSDMEYHIFDTVNEKPQHQRIMHLTHLPIREEHDSLKTVKSYLLNDLHEVEYHLKEFLEEGYEGIIIRNPIHPYVRKKSTCLMKLKPRMSDSFPVVGFREEVSIAGNPKEALGALELLGPNGERFWVGSGFTRKQRIELWKDPKSLIASMVKIRFQDFTVDRHVPKMQSFVKFI